MLAAQWCGRLNISCRSSSAAKLMAVWFSAKRLSKSLFHNAKQFLAARIYHAL